MHGSFQASCSILKSWTHTNQRVSYRPHSGGVDPSSNPAFPRRSLRDLAPLIILNSAVIALSCGTYHSFCGNGAHGGFDHPKPHHSHCNASSLGTNHMGPTHINSKTHHTSPSPVERIRNVVCSHWLPPVPIERYPQFSAWMLYGEVSGAVLEPTSSSGTSPSLCGLGGGDMTNHADFKLQGRNGGTLSPVLTIWLTLVVLYLVNCAADMAAVACLQAEVVCQDARNGDIGTTAISSRGGSRVSLHRLRGRGDYMQRWGAAGGGPLSALDRFRQHPPGRPPRAVVGGGGGGVKRTIQKGHAVGVSLISRLGTAIGSVPPGMRPKLLQKV